MAKFTAGRDLNMAYHGHDLHGPAGTVFRLPDSLRTAFQAEYGYFGLSWTDADEIANAVGGGPHTHDEYAGVAHSHAHNHDGSYSVSSHAHSATYAALAHAHAQSAITNLTADLAAKADAHTHPYAASGHTHAYAAASHSHLDADLPAGIARDTEVGAAIVAHEASATHGGQGGPAFPVGSVFLAVVSTNPATLLGYGTWVAFGAGRMLVGLDAGNVAFDTAEETGGAATHTHAAHTGVINHTHTVSVTDPGHFHAQSVNSATTGTASGYTPDTSTGTSATSGYNTGSKVTGISASTANPAGGVASLAHDSPTSLPPYIVVFMWKRTA